MFLLDFWHLFFWLDFRRWLIFRLFKLTILVYFIREETENKEAYATYRE